MVADEVVPLLAPYGDEVRHLALELRTLVREVVPKSIEEVDPSAKLIAFTFVPGTYKGLFVAVAPQKSHVNLMFSDGIELMDLDASGLLEGTGKRARHIKFRDRERLARPEIRTLIQAAAQRRAPRT